MEDKEIKVKRPTRRPDVWGTHTQIHLRASLPGHPPFKIAGSRLDWSIQTIFDGFPCGSSQVSRRDSPCYCAVHDKSSRCDVDGHAYNGSDSRCIQGHSANLAAGATDNFDNTLDSCCGVSDGSTDLALRRGLLLPPCSCKVVASIGVYQAAHEIHDLPEITAVVPVRIGL